jgi:hypothetical protein
MHPDQDPNGKKTFLLLWKKGMSAFHEGRATLPQIPFCERDRKFISYWELKDQKCWECNHFILNKTGKCDPL